MHYLRGNPRYMVSQASDKVSGQKRGGEEQANPTGIPPPKKQLMAPGKGSKEIPAGRG